jgi:hypothetical protein
MRSDRRVTRAGQLGIMCHVLLFFGYVFTKTCINVSSNWFLTLNDKAPYYSGPSYLIHYHATCWFPTRRGLPYIFSISGRILLCWRFVCLPEINCPLIILISSTPCNQKGGRIHSARFQINRFGSDAAAATGEGGK